MGETYPRQPDAPTAFYELMFALRSSASLLQNRPDGPGVTLRPAYLANATERSGGNWCTEADILNAVVGRIQQMRSKPTLDFRPYWDKRLSFHPAGLFGAIVQSSDLYDAPIPAGTFPPEPDVVLFLERLRGLGEPTKVSDQFAIAMDLTRDDIVGAAHLACVAVRAIARGADQRAYPTLPTGSELVGEACQLFAPFEMFDDSTRNDAPGDAHYFWAHAFGALVFSDKGMGNLLAQGAFSRGTHIMEAVRGRFAISSHQPASMLGRKIGLTLAHVADIPFDHALPERSSATTSLGF